MSGSGRGGRGGNRGGGGGGARGGGGGRSGGRSGGGGQARGGGGRSGGGGSGRGGGGGGGGRGGYTAARGGGGGGGGRNSGGRGGGGGGGRASASAISIAQNPKSALSNLILADVTPNMKFYSYGLDSETLNGKQIDSKRRRWELFDLGLFDPSVGLLAKMGLTKKEIDDFKRVTFFEGSIVFCSRPIPGVEQLPHVLVGASSSTSKKKSSEQKGDEDDLGPPPVADNGDSLRVMTRRCLVPPSDVRCGTGTGAASTSRSQEESKTTTSPRSRREETKSGGREESKSGREESKRTSVQDEVLHDNRCAECTRSFNELTALMQHCQITGHNPVFSGDEDGPQAATREEFLAYCNVALNRALNERMARWGRDYIDPKSFTSPVDRSGKSLGVSVFKAYSCEFGLHRKGFDTPQSSLTLTVDLKAKILRNRSVLEQMYDGFSPSTPYNFSTGEQNNLKRQWISEVVICTYDKRCYSVTDLLFDKSPASMPIPGTKMSHADYFKKKKNIQLLYPNSPPLIEVLGRNNSKIYFPAELVCGNELEPNLKMQLPLIASFKPPERHAAIEEIRRYLIPGAQRTKGKGGDLLPALGITLKDHRLKVGVECLTLPQIIVAGIQVPAAKGNMWAPMISKADFKVNPQHCVQLKAVVIYHQQNIGEQGARNVYNRIRDIVNKLNAKYRLGDTPHMMVPAGDMERHWGPVEKYFSGNLPPNLFVIDLCKPRGRTANDPAYPVIKSMLGKAGHLSQFVNFNTYDHKSPRDFRKSDTILQGVGRQVLSKCGVRIWWVSVPRSLPTPALFVGVDVFHAPRKYDPKQKKRVGKESVAAVIVEVLRDHDPRKCPTVEIYSETTRRDPGKEMELGDVIEGALKNALKLLKVSNPKSCVVWRDGVGNVAIQQVADQEIPKVRYALSQFASGPIGSGGGAGGGGPARPGSAAPGAAAPAWGKQGSKKKPAAKTATAPAAGTTTLAVASKQVPLAYMVVQKRIATKFLSEDGQRAMPPGALVSDLQGPEHKTFYINGNAPPYSTPKPARFVIAQRDDALTNVSMADLSWAKCHDYPNWTGSIKLPAPVQCAHKLAELAGSMSDCGQSLNAKAYANKIYFL